MSKITSAAYQIPAQGRSMTEISGQIAAVANQLESQAGFLFYRLLKPVAPDDPYTMLTFWQSRRHHRIATQSVVGN